jgi:putative ABC transport system ATP-binding protein
MSTMANNVAIKADGITKWFGEGEARMAALREVNLELAFGEMVYVVGPSGSGKTTLLSVLSGILRPDSGTVVSEGTDLWSLTTDALAAFRLHRIGFAFQDYHLFPRLTVAENVAIPLILRHVDWGEQQRVAIARAIVGQPDILIMDEPTASLDGDTGRAIVSFVKKKVLNDKRCILIVTHDSRIYEFASRILHMEDGRLTSEEKGHQDED